MLEQICLLAREAGAAIMAVYQGERPLQASIKADASPVTAADLAAHQVIIEGLSVLTPDIPLLSEEDPAPWSVRQHWQRYWLIDPLDGTKEFLQRNGEFTVNIALIEQGIPVLGVVYTPVTDLMYAAEHNHAWKEENGIRHTLHVATAYPPTVVISRSHQDQQLHDYLQQVGEHQTVAVGSSLKFCLVAEGKAQCYPRFNPTCIWDTAAGHAVAAAAGAHIANWQGEPLSYTPQESFINPGFCVSVG